MIKNPTFNDFKMKYKGIIYMKIGYHINEKIDEIIKRKKGE